MKTIFYIIILIFFSGMTSCSLDEDIQLKQAIKNDHRSQDEKNRDKYRNPYETLTFFGIDKKNKTLEIIPGRGWYTKIIGNYMKDTNNFYVATYQEPTYAVDIIKKIQTEFFNYFKKNQKNFGEIKNLEIDKNFNFSNYDNYFDLILTFRNIHNFLDQDKSDNIFNSINKSLKKGGILGVVQHRADKSLDLEFSKGYVKESFIIDQIESHGFELVEKSNVNSNPKDLKNYEKGVWTLPPRLVEGEKNKSLYLSIGESDRMTLKFKKVK